MSDNQRKLLPYEYQLIDALGVSKEEYLAFVAQQHIYEDPKTGTILDVRNWPAVAIVLTIVGVLFQVASVLLAPKPTAPRFTPQAGAGPGQPGSRDNVFAPRSGFNSVQQLASYGDPVNLVYTNTSVNPSGGVRIATSLLFSAIRAYGGSQFIQILALIGGGSIESIDSSRSAFGQIALRDIPSQNYWLYFKPGSTGRLNNEHLLKDNNPTLDPGAIGQGHISRFSVEIETNGEKREGFSHAYTPSSSNVFGIYGVVPSNIDILVRNEIGNYERARIGTDFRDTNNLPADPHTLYPSGKRWYFTIASAVLKTGATLASDEASEMRRSYTQVFDMAGTFKYGAIKLKVIGMSSSDNVDQPMRIDFQALNNGYPVSLASSNTDLVAGVLENRPGQFEKRPLATNLKAIVRIEEASYETVSPCNIVDFTIKAKVFKRISGRQTQYGGESPGYPVSDNGIKPRAAIFVFKFKAVDDKKYTYFPGFFVVERASDVDNYIHFRFNASNFESEGPKNWQFVFEPIYEPDQEVRSNPTLKRGDGDIIYHYLENGGKINKFEIGRYGLGSNGKGIVVEYFGRSTSSFKSYPPRGVYKQPQGTHTWDLFISNSDQNIQYSFDNGPEFAISSATEHILKSYKELPGLWNDLSLIGLAMYSGKTVQDLRSFSAFVTKGRKSRLLITDAADGLSQQSYLSSTPNGWANTAPDIFVDTVLDVNDGIGKFASIYSVDLEQLARSKRFCLTNKLFMDCAITEPSSWRSFWAEIAGFSLLELAKIGGQDTLIPAVPYNTATGQFSSQLAISALFNQGNILEDSYKEEFIDYGSNSQDVIVRVIYRTIEKNAAFARNTSVNVKLSDVSEDNALSQTIDASNYVTRREQAILIGKLLCLTKRYSRRAIEFKTFPTDSPVFPGAYIYVELAHNSWEKIYSGIVAEDGILNTPSSIPSGNYAALLYTHGTNTSLNQPSGTEYFQSIAVTNDKGKISAPALAKNIGRLFVLGNAVMRKRVFRVTEVNMDEEGEVTIRAIEHATDSNGRSQIGLGIIGGSWSID